MLPARNRKDFEDIPEKSRASKLEFIWLERVEDAVAAALEPKKADAAPGTVPQLVGAQA